MYVIAWRETGWECFYNREEFWKRLDAIQEQGYKPFTDFVVLYEDR